MAALFANTSSLEQTTTTKKLTDLLAKIYEDGGCTNTVTSQ